MAFRSFLFVLFSLLQSFMLSYERNIFRKLDIKVINLASIITKFVKKLWKEH